MSDFEERRKASIKMREKYPDRCCIIVKKMEGADIPDIDRNKYLVPQTLSMGQFVYVIRKRLSLPQDKALFIYVGNILPSTSDTVGNVYNRAVVFEGDLWHAADDYFGDSPENG